MARLILVLHTPHFLFSEFRCKTSVSACLTWKFCDQKVAQPTKTTLARYALQQTRMHDPDNYHQCMSDILYIFRTVSQSNVQMSICYGTSPTDDSSAGHFHKFNYDNRQVADM